MKLVSSSFFFLYGIGLNLPVLLNAAPGGNRIVGSNSNYAAYAGMKNGAQINAGYQSQASRNPQNASGNVNKIGNQKKQHQAGKQAGQQRQQQQPQTHGAPQGPGNKAPITPGQHQQAQQFQ